MKRVSAVVLTFLLMAIPVFVFAKGNTVKITISAGDLQTPIQITDAEVLKNFRVWSGPGTTSNDAESFIVDWSQGATAQPPPGLRRYQVFFYAGLPGAGERLVYVVFYEYDPAAGRGYVYLPGRTEPWHGLNVGTIIHGVEGNWFRASDAWDSVASPLIPPQR